MGVREWPSDPLRWWQEPACKARPVTLYQPLSRSCRVGDAATGMPECPGLAGDVCIPSLLVVVRFKLGIPLLISSHSSSSQTEFSATKEE